MFDFVEKIIGRQELFCKCCFGCCQMHAKLHEYTITNNIKKNQESSRTVQKNA